MALRLLELFIALLLVVNLFIVGFCLLFRQNLYKKYYKVFLRLIGECLIFIVAIIITFSLLGLLH